MSRQENRRFFLDCIILKRLEEPSQQCRVEVVLKLFKRKREFRLWLLLNLRDNKQIQKNQDHGFQSTSRTAQRNQPLFLFTEKHLPVSLRFSGSCFIVNFDLNLGKLAVVSK